MFLERIIFSTRAPLKYDHLEFFIITCGATVVTCMASLFVWLVVEAPLTNICDAIMSDKKSPQKENEMTNEATQNGQKKVL
ncbi:hypothetical protein O3G_MSEX015478 [Manduca sexta]|uniref:Uncharacterized protein n=1 Tax=Manduca sexta TaxID=7130 RepID=A0A922A0X1_MANSE|nr:hypothetical protein O3G_MSEX015478 [Manduca sexta]